MKVLVEGHRYELANFEEKDKRGQFLQFIYKEPINKPDKPTELTTVSDGTTNEEVIEALIDRMNYLQGKFPCRENALAITKFQEGLFWLNERTRDRLKRQVEGKNQA